MLFLYSLMCALQVMLWSAPRKLLCCLHVAVPLACISLPLASLNQITAGKKDFSWRGTHLSPIAGDKLQGEIGQCNLSQPTKEASRGRNGQFWQSQYLTLWHLALNHLDALSVSFCSAFILVILQIQGKLSH